MMAGIVAGGLLNPFRFQGSPATLWTPLNMAAVPQIYLDAQDSTLTDVSGACSAISNLGAMGAGGDFSQATAGSRPTILNSELNGNRVLRFDGSNDYMTGAAGSRDVFKNVSAAWAMYIYKKRTTDTAPTNRYLFHTTTGTSISPRFSSQVGSSVAGNQNRPRMSCVRLDSQTETNLIHGSAVSGSYSMQLHYMDYSTRTGRLYKDGTMTEQNTAFTVDAGNTSNTKANGSPNLGSFSGGSACADVDLAAVVVSNVLPASGEIDKLFGWAAHKYGLTASLPGGHPYKTVAPTV